MGVKFFLYAQNSIFRGGSCNLLISNRYCTLKWVKYLGESAAHFGTTIERKRSLSACYHVVWIVVLPDAGRVSSTREISIRTVLYMQSLVILSGSPGS